ncbi:hypothetical protein PCE1_004138 [Barthelona sp. PCE]
MRLQGLFLFLILSSSLLLGRATILSAEGCTKLVQARNPKYTKYCKYPAYRSHLGRAADRYCGGFITEKCLKRILKSNGGSLDRAIPRTNRISNSKIAIIDSHKYTEVTAETIDIPGLGVPTEQQLPSHPKRDPKMRGQPATVRFGAVGHRATVLKGVFDPKTGQFWMDSVSRPPVPVYSNVPFKLTELNPKKGCQSKKGGFFGKLIMSCKPWVTSSENPSVDVYIPNDEEFKTFAAGSVFELKMRSGDVNLVYKDDHLIKHKTVPGRGGFFARFKLIAIPAHVQMYRVGGSGMLKHGDIVSFCRDGVKKIQPQRGFAFMLKKHSSVECPRFKLSTEH